MNNNVTLQQEDRERRLFLMSFAVAICQILYFAEWIFVYNMGRDYKVESARAVRSQIHEVAMIIVAGYNPVIYLTFNKTLREHFCKFYFPPLKRCFRQKVTIQAESTGGCDNA